MAITCAEEVDVRGEEGREIDVGMDFCARAGSYWVGFYSNEFKVGMELVEVVDVGEGIAWGLRSEVRAGGEELLDFDGVRDTCDELLKEML